MNVDILILGAGIAGIGAGYRYKNSSVIFEKRDRFGGLCDNFTVNGFRFDHAVHLSFASEEVVREIFDKVPFYTHKPISMNYSSGTWAKHPIQNNSYNFPTQEKIEIIKSFINRKNNDLISNYDEWLVAQYGDYFAKNYPGKYTRKYWCHEAHELSTSWIEGRMYLPSIDEVLEGALTLHTPNTYYAKEMRYPKKGGYRAFIENVANECRIELNHKAIKVNLKDKNVYFDNGRSVHYQNLVSSLPLPELVKIIDDCPVSVTQASRQLKATSVCLVSIGFSTEITFPSLWFYVYDEDIFFARAYSPSMKSKDNAPIGKSSLQFEIYQLCDSLDEYQKQKYVDNVINSMEKMGIANRSDIEILDCRLVDYANVIFSHDMEENRKIVLDYLQSVNIKSIGRFGEWGYLWSNQSFLSGYNVEIENEV